MNILLNICTYTKNLLFVHTFNNKLCTIQWLPLLALICTIFINNKYIKIELKENKKTRFLRFLFLLPYMIRKKYPKKSEKKS